MSYKKLMKAAEKYAAQMDDFGLAKDCFADTCADIDIIFDKRLTELLRPSFQNVHCPTCDQSMWMPNFAHKPEAHIVCPSCKEDIFLTHVDGRWAL